MPKDIAGMHTGVKCVNCKKEFNLFTSKDSEECDDCYNESQKIADEIDEHIRMEEEDWKERKFHPPFNLNYKTGKYDDPKDLV